MSEIMKEFTKEVEDLDRYLKTTEEEILKKRKAVAETILESFKTNCTTYREVEKKIDYLINDKKFEGLKNNDTAWATLHIVRQLLEEEMHSLQCNTKNKLENRERLTKEDRDLLEAIETAILEGMGTKKLAGITMDYINEGETQLTNNKEVKDIRERSFNSAREGEIIILPNERIKLIFGKVKESEGIKGIELKIENF